MKNLLPFRNYIKALLLVVQMSYNVNYNVGNLEVMTEDLGEMNWEDAMKACADLGDGWRLPTKLSS